MDLFKAMAIYKNNPQLLNEFFREAYVKYGQSCETCEYLKKTMDASRSDYYCDKLKRDCGSCIRFVSCGLYERRRF